MRLLAWSISNGSSSKGSEGQHKVAASKVHVRAAPGALGAAHPNRPAGPGHGRSLHSLTSLAQSSRPAPSGSCSLSTSANSPRLWNSLARRPGSNGALPMVKCDNLKCTPIDAEAMYLFKITQDSVVRLEEHSLEKEEKLQKLVVSNLRDLLGIRPVKQYHTVPVYGQIDALGIDEDMRPVIIEFKKESSEDVITQALDYAHWLQSHPSSFQQLVSEAGFLAHDLGDLNEDTDEQADDVDFDHFRILIIARDFSDRQVRAAEVAGPSIELIEYKYFQLGNETLLGLDWKVESDRKAREEWDLDHYFVGKAARFKDLYNKLDAKIRTMVGAEVTLYKLNPNSIAYKTERRKFLSVRPSTTKIYINGYLGDLKDQFKQAHGEPFRYHKSGWVFYDIHNEQDLENPALDELIELAYKSCS